MFTDQPREGSPCPQLHGLCEIWGHQAQRRRLLSLSEGQLAQVMGTEGGLS